MDIKSIIALIGGNAVLLGFAVWLLKGLIEKRMTAAISHEFEIKSLRFKSTISEMELRLNDSLSRNTRDLSELRAGPMSVLTQRQSLYDKRRMDSADVIWKAVRSLSHAKNITISTSRIDLIETSKHIKSKPEQRATLKALGTNLSEDHSAMIEAEFARPFVPPMLWALYKAYAMTCQMGVLGWKLTMDGIYDQKLFKSEEMQDVMKLALPGRAEILKKYQENSYPYFLDELEVQIVKEIGKMFSSLGDEKESIKQAAEILKQSNLAMQKIRNSTGDVEAL